MQEWGCGMGLAHSLALRLPRDLPPQQNTAAAGDTATVEAESEPPPEVETALMAPYYLFGDSRVAYSGWLTPRPRPWGAAVHLVAFPRSFALVRADSGECPGRKHRKVPLCCVCVGVKLVRIRIRIR